jgi:hypothetical protein
MLAAWRTLQETTRRDGLEMLRGGFLVTFLLVVRVGIAGKEVTPSPIAILGLWTAMPRHYCHETPP